MNTKSDRELSASVNRRGFMDDMSRGLSGIALASLLAGDELLSGQASVAESSTANSRATDSGKAPSRPKIDPSRPFAARDAHFTARAKNVVVIFCSGACSHLDTFDYKPELIARHGQSMPGADGLITFQGEQGNLTKSPWKFRPRGESGKWFPISCRNWATSRMTCASSTR